MNATAIPRIAFDKSAHALSSERVKLANNAKEKLGYNRLAQAISAPGALLFAMCELGIEPLVRDQVETYKHSKEINGMWSGHKWGIGEIIASFIGCAIFIKLTPYMRLSTFTLFQPLCLASFAGSVILFLRGTYMLFDSDAKGHRTKREWSRIAVNLYSGNIPEYVLEKAIQIKDKCPSAEFMVDRLIQTREDHPRPLPDPFLIVFTRESYKDEYARTQIREVESYYLDVWNEREYEAKL